MEKMKQRINIVFMIGGIDGMKVSSKVFISFLFLGFFFIFVQGKLKYE